jgi:hypothetical protein
MGFPVHALIGLALLQPLTPRFRSIEFRDGFEP